MISKIIQKEKARQEELILNSKRYSLKNNPSNLNYGFAKGELAAHEQSLINLKEYIQNLIDCCCLSDVYVYDRAREDIEELNLMIEKYA